MPLEAIFAGQPGQSGESITPDLPVLYPKLLRPSAYDLSSDPIHKFTHPNLPAVRPPGYQHEYQLACEIPAYLWPHNVEKLGMVRYLPSPEEEVTSRRLLVYGDEDEETIPVLYGFLYTHPTLECDVCEEQGIPCLQYRWDGPGPGNAWPNKHTESITVSSCVDCYRRGKTCNNKGRHILEPARQRLSITKLTEGRLARERYEALFELTNGEPKTVPGYTWTPRFRMQSPRSHKRRTRDDSSSADTQQVGKKLDRRDTSLQTTPSRRVPVTERWTMVSIDEDEERVEKPFEGPTTRTGRPVRPPNRFVEPASEDALAQGRQDSEVSLQTRPTLGLSQSPDLLGLSFEQLRQAQRGIEQALKERRAGVQEVAEARKEVAAATRRAEVSERISRTQEVQLKKMSRELETTKGNLLRVEQDSVAARHELDESYEKLAELQLALAAARSELLEALNAAEVQLEEAESPTTVQQGRSAFGQGQDAQNAASRRVISLEAELERSELAAHEQQMEAQLEKEELTRKLFAAERRVKELEWEGRRRSRGSGIGVDNEQ